MNTLVIKDVPLGELRTHSEFDGHQRIVRFEDTSCGLVGFVAIHRRRGTLSTGGTRYATYSSEADALADALRLSRAMTAKCIVSDLPYGGAKGVIIARSIANHKSEALLGAYAKVVASLQGEFRTGEDVGMTEDDVQYLITQCPYFNGKRGIAGDPSPYAAKSVAMVMERMSLVHLERPLTDLRISVKGVGKVGGALVNMLHQKGAKLQIADIRKEATEELLRHHAHVTQCDSKDIAFLSSDIYSPCALGNEFNEATIEMLDTRMICGGANNQLADPRIAGHLHAKGILYVPDYLANAGGVINVSDELEADGYHKERVAKRIAHLATLAERLYNSSRTHSRSLFDETEIYVRDNS